MTTLLLRLMARRKYLDENPEAATPATTVEAATETTVHAPVITVEVETQPATTPPEEPDKSTAEHAEESAQIAEAKAEAAIDIAFSAEEKAVENAEEIEEVKSWQEQVEATLIQQSTALNRLTEQISALVEILTVSQTVEPDQNTTNTEPSSPNPSSSEAVADPEKMAEIPEAETPMKLEQKAGKAEAKREKRLVWM